MSLRMLARVFCRHVLAKELCKHSGPSSLPLPTGFRCDLGAVLQAFRSIKVSLSAGLEDEGGGAGLDFFELGEGGFEHGALLAGEGGAEALLVFAAPDDHQGVAVEEEFSHVVGGFHGAALFFEVGRQVLDGGEVRFGVGKLGEEGFASS